MEKLFNILTSYIIMTKYKVLMMLINPKNILIFIIIHIIYFILISYLSTINLNISFFDRLELTIYTQYLDPLKAIMLILAPSLIAIYYLLNMCRASRINLSIPITTTLASGFTCIGCTFPILASLGMLSSLISLMLPISILIMLYIIDKKLSEIEHQKLRC